MKVKIKLTINEVDQDFEMEVNEPQDITEILWEVRTEIKGALFASNRK